MKKRIISFLMAMLMVLFLVGCGKTTISIEFKGADGIEVINAQGIKGGVSSQDNVLVMTSTKDGEYPLVVNVDGEECIVTITFKNGDATVVTEPQVDFTAIVK